MNMTTRFDAFKAWWDNGFRDLIPVIPPNAELSPNSYIAKNDGAGKAPGIRYGNGLWGGMPGWREHKTTEQDVASWYMMGASVGLRRGDAFMLDIDAYDEDVANMIEAAAIEALGPAPMRVGQWPKRALLYRADGPISGFKLTFDGSTPGQVEIPAQTVIYGIHKKTGKLYDWPRKPVGIDKLSVVSADKLNAFMEQMRRALPKAQRSDVVSSTDREKIDQRALMGDPDLVAEAVRRLPNTQEAFPTYDDMIRVLNAISAALPAHRDLAADLSHDWCSRWEGGDYDHDLTERRLATIKPPHSFGAQFLYRMADKLNPRTDGKSFEAMSIFDALPDDEIELNPFKDLEAEEAKQPIIKATPYSFKDPRAVPKREWLYGNHYIRKFVSATVAPSGVGKSSLEIVEALVMATGKPLLGVEPKGQFRVWLWNGEDPIDELERRIGAARLHYGITDEDIGDRLFIDSGRQQEIILATTTRNGTVIAEPTVAALISEIKLNRFDVIQIDPFVSSHRVVENDNGAIDLVSKKWANIADTCNCAVELVHHVRKLNGAEITIEDSRGAGSLIATSRSARALTKMQKGEAARLGLESVYRRLFRFGDGKNNLALPADERTEWMELASVPLGNGGGDSLDAVMKGDIIGVVARFKMPEAAASVSSDEKSAALDLIRAGEWRKDVRAGDAWVGNPIAQAMQLDLSEETDKAHVKGIITAWIRDGVLKEVSRQDAKRMQKTFVEVADKDSLSNDIFS